MSIEEITKERMIAEHETYPDIMPHGIEEYPFCRSRISPLLYEIPDGSKVLDVGCNSGEFMKLLKEKRNCDVYGIDISRQVVDLAKAKGLNAQVADADKLPYPDKSFDVVCLMETLEHFYDPIPYLKEIRRVLRKNGFLLGSCPHANLENHLWDDARLHHQYYKEENLTKDLKQVFDNVYLRILKGHQFTMAFANSYLCDEPCEILFKCGGKSVHPWEEALKKAKVTRVWFGFTQLAGTVYYRMRGYADKMNKFGIESAYEAFKYDGSESQSQWQSRITNTIVQNQLDQILRVADISIWQLVQNRYALAFLMCAKDLFKKPVLTEIDDWLLDLPAYNVASNPYQPNSEMEWICFEQLKLSDAFIVSTRYMIDHLMDIFPNKPMYLVPNSIDFDIWDNLKPIELDEFKKEPGTIRIGYTGCGNHSGDLELIKMPLLKIIDEFPNVEFMTSHKYGCFQDVNHPRMKFLNRWTMMDKFPHEVAGWKMDIGIAPLRDNNFNRSKSNLRWLEYSALKIPTIASRVYPFKTSIINGEDGLICNTELEWYEAMKRLIVNEGERITMGNQSYKRVKKGFNMDDIAKYYAEILRDIHHEQKRFRGRDR